MDGRLKTIFIFVDGLGLGAADPATNPLCSPRLPNLVELLKQAVPLDACLGFDGLPQSATGQATLLTGINAAAAMGRHIEGFPPPALKELVERENLFTKLAGLGHSCTFANCYWGIDPQEIPARRQSVTTVMTLAALGRVQGDAALRHGLAVTHDITRWTMHTRGYDGPLVQPEEAARHLLALAERNDFTLFEYFLTDRAGHSGHPELVEQCLGTLERFLPEAARFAEGKNRLLLICSDHGNIEDSTTRSHTLNPVPLIALGTHAETFRTLRSLEDVAPAILRLYAAQPTGYSAPP